jgi:hypothetical protein
MITDAGQVLHAPPANEDDGMFLQIMPYAWDVSRYLYAVSQADAGNLAESRVGLLRRYGINAGADTSALRVFL